jgi:signal transduction histidine kinase
MQYIQTSLSLAETLQDERGIGDGLLTQGRLKRELGNYDEALEDITSSLSIYRTIPDSSQIANALNDISIVYAMSGNDDKALEYFEETLRIFRRIGDTKGESQALNNIGIIHESAGRITLAQDYLLRSLQIKKSRKDTVDISRSYHNLGNIAQKMGQMKEALDYYEQANVLFRNTNDKQGLAGNLNAIAGFYFQQDKLHMAKTFATEGLSIAQQINSKPLVKSTSETLVDIAEKLQDYPAAFRYLQILTAVKDSLYNKNQADRLAELKTRFDNEMQASEIAMLKKDQQLQEAHIEQQEIIKYSLMAGILLLSLLLGFFIYANRINRRQKKLLRTQNLEIQQQQQSLKELNHTKDRLFSIISHDIKGPLNTLKGFVFLLSQQVDGMSLQEVKEMSARIGDSLGNLHQLLENLLTWSLSQLQQQTINPECFSIHALAQNIVQLYEPTATEKKITILNKADREIEAWADRNAVHTVLRNLLANSIKFSHAHTTVEVETEVRNGEVMVSVTDQGTGIDPEVVAKLFSLDKKTTGTGTANEQGSGFGLILCQELVKKNKGHLWVESEKGKGSTFTFTLPLAQYASIKEKVRLIQVDKPSAIKV